MEIRKFTKQKDGMYKIKFDEFSVIIHEELILKYDLLIKKNLTILELDKIKQENSKYEAYNLALKLIKKHLRTTLEVKRYLNENNTSEKDITFVCELLQKQGYLNDLTYATSYLHDKINMSLDGPLKISNSLKNSGISNDIIQQVMIEFSKDLEEEKVDKIIEKNIKTNKNKSINNLKLKLKAALFSLGYDPLIVNEKINSIKFDDNEVKLKEYEKIKRQLSKKYSGKELEYKIKQKMFQKGFNNLDFSNFYDE